MNDVAIVVLAAGSSLRFGAEPKQLADLDGRALLQHVIDGVASLEAAEVVVVLGHRADEVRAALTLPDDGRIVVNENPDRGLASSLRIGLAACNPDVAAAVLLLGDQPGLSTRSIRMVVDRWRKGSRPIVRSMFRDRPGHPVVLGRSVWNELDEEGDAGARTLMARRPDLVEDVDLAENSPSDVDTYDDLERARRG